MKTDITKPQFDTDVAWQKLDARIKTALSHPVKTSSSTYLYKRIGIAAAIVLLATASWLIWKIANPWETIVASVSNQSLVLPDGSSVILRKGSILHYKSAFHKRERAVHLTGEAFFEVRPDHKYPFSIITKNTEVKVLGTSFLVRSQARTDEIIVASGRVGVVSKSRASDQILLEAGQKLILEKGQPSQTTINDSNYLAWKTGILDFKETPLPKVLEDLEHYYETPLTLEEEHLKTTASAIRLTARFQQQSLEQALEEIQLITGLEMKKENGKIIFYKK